MNYRFLLSSLLLLSPLLAEHSDQVTVEMKVEPILSLHLSEHSHDFAAATAADLSAGFTEEPQALTARVRSNQPWALAVQAETNTLGQLASGAKPVSDLLWKRSDQSEWSPLSTRGEAVKSSLVGSGRTEIPIDLRVALNWNEDGPGNYETTLIFTLGTLL